MRGLPDDLLRRIDSLSVRGTAQVQHVFKLAGFSVCKTENFPKTLEYGDQRRQDFNWKVSLVLISDT
jgi:hypothetical protein